MKTFILSLPSYRLKITISKRKFLREKKSLRFNQVLRRLFEHKRLKAILGGNLALLVLFTSVFSPSVSALEAIGQTEVTTLSADTVELATKQSVRVPLEKIEITQSYSFFHSGLDLNGETGDPVYPMMAGTVESIVYERFGLGKHVIITHDFGFKSIYAHLSKIEVEAGQKVETGQVIGRVGSTGRSFGDHLHFEVLENDRHVNPRTILPIK